MADAGFDLQIEKYAKRTNREPFGLPEGSFPLSEQAVMNLFDCIQQQLTLEKIDLRIDAGWVFFRRGIRRRN